MISQHFEERYGIEAPTGRDIAVRFWISVLSRLLLRIKSYRHGGAILFASLTAEEILRVKYDLHYLRLRDAVPKFVFQALTENYARSQMHEKEIKMPLGTFYPKRFALDALAAGDQMQQTDREIDDAIWFVSTLSRIDGLVLMDPFLGVHGFGAEIRIDADPPNVYLAGDAAGSTERRVSLDPTRYGMRHRSMMRWCWTQPESVGFVVSQDGDVRGIMRVNDGVMLWDNIKLDRFLVNPVPEIDGS